MQCVDLIRPILLTYNNKLVHATTGLTKESRDPSNELQAYVNMKCTQHAPKTKTLKYKLATKSI